MSGEVPEPGEVQISTVHRGAYEAVRAVLSDDHNFDQGVRGARAAVDAVFAEVGVLGLREMSVELTLKLAEALERIAAQERLAAVDLAEVWFVA